jgi:hypothetical protein
MSKTKVKPEETRRPVGRPPKGDKAKRRFFMFQHTISRSALFEQARRIVTAKSGAVSDSQVFDTALIALIISNGGGALDAIRREVDEE